MEYEQGPEAIYSAVVAGESCFYDTNVSKIYIQVSFS